MRSGDDPLDWVGGRRPAREGGQQAGGAPPDQRQEGSLKVHSLTVTGKSLNFADILVVVQLIRRQMRTNNSWTTIRKSWDFWQWLLIDHKYFIYYHMLLIYDWSRSIDHWLSFISWPARVVQVAHVAPDPPAVVEQPQGVHVLQGAAVVAAAAVVRHSTCEAIVRSGYFGCNTGNGKKLSSSQVQLGQATCFAVA